MRNGPPDAFYDLYDRLMAVERSLGKSVDDVADEIGVDRSRLYRFTRRTDGPSGSVLAAMADHWGMTMDELWNGTGPVPLTPVEQVASALEADVTDLPAPEPQPPRVERRRRYRRATDSPRRP